MDSRQRARAGSHTRVSIATAAVVPSKAFLRVEDNEERGQGWTDRRLSHSRYPEEEERQQAGKEGLSRNVGGSLADTTATAPSVGFIRKAVTGRSEALGCDEWMRGSGVQGLPSLTAIPVSSQITSGKSCKLSVPYPDRLENGTPVFWALLFLVLPM